VFIGIDPVRESRLPAIAIGIVLSPTLSAPSPQAGLVERPDPQSPLPQKEAA
jgi:hypothetical protein